MTLVLLSLLATTARAADVDDFAPSSSQVVGTGTLQGEMPTLPTEGAAAGLLMGFIQDPVVRTDADGNVRDLVSAMLPVALYGGYTVADKFRFDVFFPVYAHVEAPANDFSGPALGDLRVQAIIPFGAVGPVQIGFVPRFELPTGTRAAVTHKGLAAGGHLALGNEVNAQFGWLANSGFTGSGADRFEDERLGSSFDTIVGGWYRASEAFRIGAEADLRIGLIKARTGANANSSAHLFAQQVLPSGVGMTLGAGAGLIGTSPDYRILAGIHYGAGSPDPDGDGLLGADDLCANLAEDIDGFEDEDGCPDDDNDGDGVVDADDRCANSPEDLDRHDDTDGCPDLDNDGDGVLDADDLCPDSAGEAQGCPDTDGDGVWDDRDACPTQPRPDDERLEVSDGCPKGVYLTDYVIAHDTQVLFDGRGSELDPSTHHVLDAVIGLMLDHPEIAKLEVQAHIDDSGSERRDAATTRVRAQAAITYLVQGGLDAERLEPRGMGHTDPIDTNRTETGRLHNRRLVFRIVTVDRSRIKHDADAPQGSGENSEVWTPNSATPPKLFDLPEEEPTNPEDAWAPTRPEPKEPTVDVEPEPPADGKRPPRSSKKR